MRHVRRFLAKAASFLWRGRAERELAREVAAHLALLEEEFERRGMTAKEARLAALRTYGGVEQVKELHRDERSFVGLEQFLQDLRHAVRGLAKSPAFVAVAVLTLAFGIGVNAAIFTLVNGILLKKLPVAEPERIVQIKVRVKGLDSDASNFSYPAFRALSEQRAIFTKVAGFKEWARTLELQGAQHRTTIQTVTGEYFSLFGGRPVLGRLLNDEDDRLRGERSVCVLSYHAWQTYLNGDPRALGQTIRLDGKPFEIVGVAAADFTGAELQEQFEFWVPTGALEGRDNPRGVWMRVMARLAPGVSVPEARARLAAASDAIKRRLPPGTGNADGVYLFADGSMGYDRFRTNLRGPLVILMGAVTMVLLVACANLTNLLLARTEERAQEFAVKLALGASRWRLARQLLMEALLLAFSGGLPAVLLAWQLNDFLLAVFNAGNRYQLLRVEPGPAVLVFTFAACVATALIAGIYPAWRGSRIDTAAGLREKAARGARRGLARRCLIAVQVTLAVVLLFGASLFTHSLRKLNLVNLGYDIDGVLSVQIVKDGSEAGLRLPGLEPPTGAQRVLPGLLTRVRQLPEVKAAALADNSPLSGSYYSGADITVLDGRNGQRTLETPFAMVGQGYFATMRMTVLRGRDFTPADRVGSRPVAIVNERLAAKLGIEEDGIGKHLNGLTWGDAPETAAEIVGMVGNSRNRDVRQEALPMVYMPFDQMPSSGGELLIRYRSGVGDLERSVQRIVKSDAPGFHVADSIPMELLRDRLLSKDRLMTFLSELFGALGTTLALVGIYGLIAYSVTRRTREIGIRLSIGAQRGQILWMFVRESLVLMGAGVVVGMPLALMLAASMRKMLFELSPSNPLDIGVTVALLTAGGMAAALVPGRRATRVDPVRALKYD